MTLSTIPLLIVLLSMNYAEDRIDRKARHIGKDDDGLWKDFVTSQEELQKSDENDLAVSHELLGRTLRDVGWIRHAVYHNGQAWMNDPTSAKAAGDYAQMAEFAGFPEIGMMALFHYRRKGPLKQPRDVSSSNATNELQSSSPKWVQQEAPAGDCGCGSRECGRYRCFVPMIDMSETFTAIQEYSTMSDSRALSMPDAHQVLTMIAKQQSLCHISEDVPPLLSFWDTNPNNYVELPPVLQLLLVKLLYLTIPSLAAEGIVQLDFENMSRQLAEEFKSHWAYYVLIRAVVLGNRIKPHRRLSLRPFYHVPVWDVLWHKDGRIKGESNGNSVDSGNVLDGIDHLKGCLKAASVESEQMPSIFWDLPIHLKNSSKIYLVGDSHVLSTAWQSITLPSGKERLIVPVVVTGVKAWHTRCGTRFFTHATLQTLLKRILHHDNHENLENEVDPIMFSAGEIDCREGIGGKMLEGYSDGAVSENYVQRTVQEYVKALDALSQDNHVKILVLPVAPHAYRSERNGKSVGRSVRRQVTQIWNSELRRHLVQRPQKVFLLDYEEEVIDSGYVLKSGYNADNTHMNSAFLPWLEKAMWECGCYENAMQSQNSLNGDP